MANKIRIEDKKISRNGTNSLSVIIPTMIVKHMALQPKDSCEMYWNGNDELTIKFKKVMPDGQ